MDRYVKVALVTLLDVCAILYRTHAKSYHLLTTSAFQTATSCSWRHRCYVRLLGFKTSESTRAL